MYNYLDLSLPRGTSKEPHLYLNSIAKPNYVKSLRRYFFYEHKEETSLYSSCLIDIKESEDLLILNYEIEVDFVSEFDPPVKEWRSKAYKFEDSLMSTLQIELRAFITNIDRHFKKAKEVKSSKAFILKLIGIITERYLRVNSSKSHRKYLTKFDQFFSAIALKVYRDYFSFLPKRYDSVFSALISYKDFDSQLAPASLEISIFDSIKEIKDDKNQFIFKIEDGPTVKSDFKHFLYGQSERISSPIRIRASFRNLSMARYLISQISFYIGVSDDFVTKQNIFLLNGKPLTVNSTYTAKTRVHAAKNADKKKKIDSIIFSHLK
jgi:hypothetical protein